MLTPSSIADRYHSWNYPSCFRSIFLQLFSLEIAGFRPIATLLSLRSFSNANYRRCTKHILCLAFGKSKSIDFLWVGLELVARSFNIAFECKGYVRSNRANFPPFDAISRLHFHDPGGADVRSDRSQKRHQRFWTSYHLDWVSFATRPNGLPGKYLQLQRSFTSWQSRSLSIDRGIARGNREVIGGWVFGLQVLAQ